MWKRGIWAAAVTMPVLAFGLAEVRETIDGYKLLSGAEIQTLLAGNTAIHHYEGAAQFQYHQADGTMKIEGRSPRVDKWKVDGDLACFDYGDGFQCWKMAVEGTTIYWFTQHGDADGETELQQDNVKNL